MLVQVGQKYICGALKQIPEWKFRVFAHIFRTDKEKAGRENALQAF
jgi:hypothetical protein